MNARRTSLWRGAAVLMPLFTAGCLNDYSAGPTANGVPLSPPPSHSQAAKQIVDQKNRLWKDPQSIRDARLGDAVLCPAGDLGSLGAVPASFCACIEANAKNGFGGYTGLKRSVIVFPPIWTGTLAISDAGTAGFPAICQLDLQPFPELDGDYVAPKSGPKPKKPAT